MTSVAAAPPTTIIHVIAPVKEEKQTEEMTVVIKEEDERLSGSSSRRLRSSSSGRQHRPPSGNKDKLSSNGRHSSSQRGLSPRLLDSSSASQRPSTHDEKEKRRRSEREERSRHRRSWAEDKDGMRSSSSRQQFDRESSSRRRIEKDSSERGGNDKDDADKPHLSSSSSSRHNNGNHQTDKDGKRLSSSHRSSSHRSSSSRRHENKRLSSSARSSSRRHTTHGSSSHHRSSHSSRRGPRTSTSSSSSPGAATSTIAEEDNTTANKDATTKEITDKDKEATSAGGGRITGDKNNAESSANDPSKSTTRRLPSSRSGNTKEEPPELMGMSDISSSHRASMSTSHRSSSHRDNSPSFSPRRLSRRATTTTPATSSTTTSSRKHNRRSTRKPKRASTRQSLVMNANVFLEQTNEVFLQKYKMNGVIYKGEFCQIHACTHIATGSHRAVKIVREIPQGDSECNRQALVKGETKCPEFEILRRIDTSFVPQIFKCYEHDGNHMIIMERCYGSNLRSELHQKSGGTLEEHVVKDIVKQLLSCLNYLHNTAHVVHCDIRPPNILLDAAADFSKIKLIDFDTAVMLQDPADKIREKRGGGEGVYMVYHAPEVHKSRPKYDAKVDLWSVGVLMYRMLYNKLPFVESKDDTKSDILKRMNAGKFRFPNRDWLDVSEDAKAFIQDLLQVKGKHRPSASTSLAHAWFQDEDASRELSERDSTVTMANMVRLSNLRKHNPNSRLKKAVCAFIGAEMLTKEEHVRADEVFQQLDILHDGKLRRHEVKAGFLLAFQMCLSEDELDDIFRRVDMDRNGSVDYTEFAVACLSEKELLTEERLKRAFARFDTHKRGYICKQALRSLPAFAGYSEDLLDFAIAEVDLKGDGKIDYVNFETVMVSARVY